VGDDVVLFMIVDNWINIVLFGSINQSRLAGIFLNTTEHLLILDLTSFRNDFSGSLYFASGHLLKAIL